RRRRAAGGPGRTPGLAPGGGGRDRVPAVGSGPRRRRGPRGECDDRRAIASALADRAAGGARSAGAASLVGPAAGQTLRRGSSVSRNPSPKRLMPSTVTRIARPGNVASHHAVEI